VAADVEIAQAYVTLRVDTRQARKEAVEETKKIGSEMNKALADAFSFAAFSKGVSSVIGSASRLEQAVGGTSAVFKEASTVIDSFAAVSAKSFGLSASAARELTSQTGALLKGLGFTTQAAAEQSVAMAKLGADLSAAFGGTPEEAVQALGSALRGEFNPAERFGASLTAASVAAKAVEMGLAETVTQVDGMAKAQATLALITEQTADVQGQYGRELDTAAGAASKMRAELEDQRAEIGNQLLPVYARTVETIGSLVGVFADLPAPVQAGVIALGGMAAMAGPVGRVVDVAGQLRGALMKMSPTMIGVGGAVTAAAVLYGVYATKKAEATERTRDLREALLQEGAAQLEAMQALAQNDDAAREFLEAMDLLGFSTREVAEYMSGTATGRMADFMQAMESSGLAVEDTNMNLAEYYRQVFGLSGATDDTAMSVGQFEGQLRLLREEQERANRIAEVAAKVTSDVAESTDFLGTAAKGAAERLEDMYVASSDLATKVGEIDVMFSQAAETVGIFQQALDLLMGAEVSLEESNRAIRDELDALTASFAENGATLDINTAKGRANREQVQANVEAILDHAEALVGSGKSAKEAGDAVDGLREMLLGQLEALGLSRAEAEDYITTLGLTPENVDTAIRLTKKEKAKQDIEEILKEIPGSVPTEIQALIDEGKYAEAKRRLLEIENPVVVPVWLEIQNPTAADELNVLDRAAPGEGGMPAAGSIPVVGGTAWWQSLMGIGGRGSTSTGSGPSGPSAEAVAFDAEFEKQKRRYTLGDITADDYLKILQALKRQYRWGRYSDRGFALQQEIDRVRDEVNEANTKDPGDPIGAAFDQAEADQAAIESRQTRRAARREAISTAMDPNASAADRKRAEEAWAQAILDDLDAQANAKGIADRTPRWARFVRGGLERAARSNPSIRDEIGVLLAGIPDFDTDRTPGGPASTSPGGSGVQGTNRVGVTMQSGGDVSPGAAGGGAVIVQTFGTERQWVEQLARRIVQLQRSKS
jgi:hypothetical protein